MEATIAQVKELGNTVIKILDRIEALEKDSAFMTDEMVANEEKLRSQMRKTSEQLAVIQENVGFIETKLKNAKIELDVLIGTLKDTAQKKHLEVVQERVDEWGPERFITKADIREHFNSED